MDIRYVGPHAAVQIAATGQTAPRGKTVTVTDELGRALCEQEYWEPAKKNPAVSKKEKPDG